MENLGEILKKTVFTLGVLGISYSSLEAQHRTGSDPDKYQMHCISKKGREANMDRYQKIHNYYYKSCNFDSKAHLNSRKYKPEPIINSKNSCVSKQAKRYKRAFKKMK